MTDLERVTWWLVQHDADGFGGAVRRRRRGGAVRRGRREYEGAGQATGEVRADAAHARMRGNRRARLELPVHRRRHRRLSVSASRLGVPVLEQLGKVSEGFFLLRDGRLVYEFCQLMTVY